MSENMKIYESLQTPPSDALKPITYGALKGKSDINPQWRYEAMTQKFGPCGTGWKFTIDSHWIQPVSTGETMVYVMISFYYKDGDKWSEPIPAYGGDYLVKKDRNGIHGNDEAMKMAVTDALGTAMKMIGVAADVYRGLIANGASDSKYARRDDYASQNGAGASKAGQRNSYPSGVQKGSESEVLRAQALKKVRDAQKAFDVSNEDVKAIISWKYNKEGWKAITLTEACDLADNLGKYALEMKAA